MIAVAHWAPSPSGKAMVCKTITSGSNPDGASSLSQSQSTAFQTHHFQPPKSGSCSLFAAYLRDP
jgi:hypothetical protein